MKKSIIITIFISALFSVNAQADCVSLAKSLVSNCLALSVKSKGDELFNLNPNCLQRRIDDIASAWQQFNLAAESKDERRITSTAVSVRFQTQYRNNMFNSCWTALKSYCKITSNSIDSDISAISESFCM